MVKFLFDSVLLAYQKLNKSLKIFSCNYLRRYSQMKGLVLGVYTEQTETCNEITELTKSFKEIDEKCDGKLSTIVKATGPFHKSVKQKLLWVSILKEVKVHIDFDCISVVDLGKKDVKDDPLEQIDQKAENVRCAVANGVKALRSASDFTDIYLDPCDNPQSAAEAASLSLFSYDVLKQQSSLRPKSRLHLYEYSKIPIEEESAFEKGTQLAECQNLGRFLMEAPANHMTPTIFANTVAEKLKDTNVKIIIRDQDWIESMKMGLFLSVSKGSDEKPKLVELHYEGAPKVEKCIALVGKGITFDSGGISLKPAKDMDKMRADMGGAACVVSTFLAAGTLGLKVNLKGFIPLTENLLGGKATKPGDVVTAMNGKTVQVDNTDAEGRLVLGDALCYAQQFKPFAIMDVATLTGAIVVALGAGVTGVYSTDDHLWELIQKAGSTTGDRVWRMPLLKYYKSSITDCALADLNNIGKSSGGGSCTAAAFLHEFIDKNTKWLHLDIAGVMEHQGETPYSTKGMSGRPIRTIVQFLEKLEDNF